MQANAAAKLKQSLRQQLHAEEEAALSEYKAKFGDWDTQVRKANRERLVSLDNMLVSTLGFGVSAFIPERAPKMLADGDRRYIANVRGPDDDEGEHSAARVAVMHSDEHRMNCCTGAASNVTR